MFFFFLICAKFLITRYLTYPELFPTLPTPNWKPMTSVLVTLPSLSDRREPASKWFRWHLNLFKPLAML